jgi:hypothetical protein
METFFGVTFAAVRFSIPNFEYYRTPFASNFDLL